VHVVGCCLCIGQIMSSVAEFQFFFLPGPSFVFCLQGKFLDIPFSFLAKNLDNVFFFCEKIGKNTRHQNFKDTFLFTTINNNYMQLLSFSQKSATTGMPWTVRLYQHW
jgi:hypothetical protein